MVVFLIPLYLLRPDILYTIDNHCWGKREQCFREGYPADKVSGWT
jgi:hypothetical protein